MLAMAEKKKGGSLKSESANKPIAAVLYANFVEIFISPKFELVSAIASITLPKDTGHQIAAAILNLFEVYCENTSDLMKWAIGMEIEQATSVSTLLRGASFSTRLMSAFFHRVGDAYLKYLLEQLFVDISSQFESLEIDPAKAQPTDNIEENYKKIQKMAEQVLERIFSSVDDHCPEAIKELLHYAKEKTQQKFPDVGQNVIGASIFLRFICPAIVAPHEAGLFSDTLTPEARRGLVLVSKLLQNLANGLQFELKEEFMIPFNKFITDNIPRVQEFYSKITAPPKEASSHGKFVPPPSSEELVGDNILLLHNFIYDNRDKIEKYMDRCFPSNFASLFMSRLDEAMMNAGNLKKKRATLSFFSRPSKNRPPSGTEDRPTAKLPHLGGDIGHIDQPVVERRLPQSHAEDSSDLVEKQFKSQVDVFVIYFQTKLKEKEKQLQEALEANAGHRSPGETVSPRKDSASGVSPPVRESGGHSPRREGRELNSSGKEDNRLLNVSASDSRINRSGSRETDHKDEEIARLKWEKTELATKVELLHEDNCKLRDQVRALSRNQTTTTTTTATSPTPAHTIIPTITSTPPPDHHLEVLTKMKADIENLTTLVARTNDEEKRKRKEKREARRIRRANSKLTSLFAGLDGTQQLAYLDKLEQLIAHDKEKM